LAWLRFLLPYHQSDAYGNSDVEWTSLTVILPPISVLTIAMADPNFSAMIHDQKDIAVTTSKYLLTGEKFPKFIAGMQNISPVYLAQEGCACTLRETAWSVSRRSLT
jgi:hypothetical protein